MRIAYLECFSGISGDMFMGALVDAGVPQRLFEDTVAALNLAAHLEISRVERSGISATKVDIYVASEKEKKGGGEILEAVGGGEAKIHNTAIDAVHFHEVGAVDAMVDIVCAAVGVEVLGVDEIVSSPLNLGGGTVQCAHGTFPVPAPATVELLKDAPVYASGLQAELVTPTGA